MFCARALEGRGLSCGCGWLLSRLRPLVRLPTESPQPRRLGASPEHLANHPLSHPPFANCRNT